MFKVQKNVSDKHYMFAGELRIHKTVMAEMEKTGSVADLFSIVDDVKKRAVKEKGLANPEQLYEHEKSGLQLVIIDKLAVEEIDKLQTLYVNRNHCCMIKLVKKL